MGRHSAFDLCLQELRENLCILGFSQADLHLPVTLREGHHHFSAPEESEY